MAIPGSPEKMLTQSGQCVIPGGALTQLADKALHLASSRQQPRHGGRHPVRFQPVDKQRHPGSLIGTDYLAQHGDRLGHLPHASQCPETPLKGYHQLRFREAVSKQPVGSIEGNFLGRFRIETALGLLSGWGGPATTGASWGRELSTGRANPARPRSVAATPTVGCHRQPGCLVAPGEPPATIRPRVHCWVSNQTAAKLPLHHPRDSGARVRLSFATATTDPPGDASRAGRAATPPHGFCW